VSIMSQREHITRTAHRDHKRDKSGQLLTGAG
jgi:hypothetical protein